MAANPLRTLDSFELLKLGKASVTVGGLAAGVLIASVVTAVLLALMLGLAIRRDRLRTEGAVA